MNEKIVDHNKLLQKIAEGDADAFTTLVNEHAGILYNFIVKLCRQPELAEEVVQDCTFPILPDL